MQIIHHQENADHVKKMWLDITTKFGKKLEKDHISFLVNKPWWTEKHTMLQTYLDDLAPDTHLVSSPDDQELIDHLLNNGYFRIVDNDLILKKMKTSRCHDNCDELLKGKKIKELHHGIALSADRLWRQHSWGIDFDNKIIETTEPRVVYLSGTIHFTHTY